MDKSLIKLSTELEHLIEKTFAISVIVSDFQPQSQVRLDQSLNDTIGLLRNIDQIKEQFQDIHVPGELLNYVDDLKNPQLFTRDYMQRTWKRNEEINGKHESLAKFADILTNELTLQFPTQLAEYRIWQEKQRSND